MENRSFDAVSRLVGGCASGRRAILALGAAGPVLVVEWGWPGPRTGWESAPHARVCTRGNGRPSIWTTAG